MRIFKFILLAIN